MSGNRERKRSGGGSVSSVGHDRRDPLQPTSRRPSMKKLILAASVLALGMARKRPNRTGPAVRADLARPDQAGAAEIDERGSLQRAARRRDERRDPTGGLAVPAAARPAAERHPRSADARRP